MAARKPKGAARTPPGLFDALPRGEAQPAQAEPRTLTVGQLTAEISGRLESLGPLRVEGELSGLKRAGSGHVYFTLKDAAAALSCAIWKSRVSRAARFELEEGMQVVAEGRLDVYAPRGTYTLIVERLEARGLGALLAQLERLKAELRAKGWFERRRPLPSLPKTIGLVTSRDTAALRDFLRTRSLRWPGYPVRLCHTPVQGAGAARSIADAIRRLDASGVDVIVVCRGGGSLEDLWCFNELAVSEAIWNARVPVVSGVGHESDVTLADLVADHRAHTPTDAAQSAIPERAALTGELARQGNFLLQAMDDALEARLQRLCALAVRPVLREPARLLGERARRLEDLHRRARATVLGACEGARRRLSDARLALERQSPRARIARWERRLAGTGARLVLLGPRALERHEERAGRLAAALEAYSPLKVLARGYSVTGRAGSTAPLVDASLLAPEDPIWTRLARGVVRARVTAVEPEDGSSPAGAGGAR